MQEQIIDISDERRRLAYAAVGGRTTHHDASIQVFAGPSGQSRILWVTDLTLEEMRTPIAEIVEFGAASMKQTLEKAFSSK